MCSILIGGLRPLFCCLFWPCLLPLHFGGVSAQEDDGLPVKPTLPSANIVGGQNADPAEWPHQVIVYAGPFMCGGSVIDKEWVLTAAHCLYDQNNQKIAESDISVVLGDYNISGTEGNEQEFGVKASIPHPNYQTEFADIGLLQLDGAANLAAANVQSIALDQQLATKVGMQAYVTGWGATSEGGAGADVLQEVVVPIVSDQVCENAYPGQINPDNICAGYQEGGKDSCQGDSGGPLVISDGNGGWIQTGVVSWGDGCAQAGKYGVYARVASYITWLEQTTGLSFGTNPPPATTPTPQPIETPDPSSGQTFLFLPFVGR